MRGVSVSVGKICKNGKRLVGFVGLHKDMIMVKSRDNIGADSMLGKPAGNSGSQAHRIEA